MILHSMYIKEWKESVLQHWDLERCFNLPVEKGKEEEQLSLRCMVD